MAQVLVRNLDSKVVDRLKARARAHGRSLQTEVKTILEREARTSASDVLAFAARIRRELAGRRHSDSARLQREDRSR